MTDDKDFTIEHYPITGKYFPKYKGKYMDTYYQSGIIRTIGDHLFAYADNFKTEKEAREHIVLFKEQQLKENVKTIQY